MNSKHLPLKKANQKGAATLLVTVILLALITLVSIYITKLGLLEVKTGANANRAKEALHHAQAGLDYGALMYLDQGSSFVSGSLSVGGTSVAVSGVVSGSLYTITATGESVDGTGEAVVQEGYGRIPVVAFGELPPLMSNGNFPPNGDFEIVANPNGGGTGVPVSAWVKSASGAVTGSWSTCNVDEFLNEGTNNSGPAEGSKTTQSDGFVTCDKCKCSQAINPLCDTSIATSSPSDCSDIVQDSNIPDTFQNTFGVDPNLWEGYRDAVAFQEIQDCSQLNSSSGERFYGDGDNAGQLPLIWITGDCDISGQVGSYDAPIILVAHGDVKLNASAVFYGIVFAFSDIYTASESNNITINGGAVVYGVILVNTDVNLPTGTFVIVYSQNILEKLSNNTTDNKYIIGRRAGSWTDF